MGRRRSTRSSWTAAWAFMAERYFEPAEVERLIPTLTRLMAGVMRANEEATTIAGRLEAERERIGLAGGGGRDRAPGKGGTARPGPPPRNAEAGGRRERRAGRHHHDPGARRRRP